jgi:hypothetical protein
LLPVVQVGGGLIVIATGWKLLKQRNEEKPDVQKTVKPQDTIRRAFYPLTLPLDDAHKVTFQKTLRDILDGHKRHSSECAD